jgi:hypothetical protein
MTYHQNGYCEKFVFNKTTSIPYWTSLLWKPVLNIIGNGRHYAIQTQQNVPEISDPNNEKNLHQLSGKSVRPMLFSSRNLIDASLYDLSKILLLFVKARANVNVSVILNAISYWNCYCDSFWQRQLLVCEKVFRAYLWEQKLWLLRIPGWSWQKTYHTAWSSDLDSQGMHWRNGKHEGLTVWGACAKYPVEDSSVTIHVTPRVRLSGSPERNWIDIHHPQCSLHDQVILRSHSENVSWLQQTW